jgi:CheY-like chemotaxis protein
LEVTIANNGKAVLEVLEDQSCDAILMDVQMPVMDGLAVTRRIRSGKIQADIPIIAVTAHAMTGDRDKSIQAGMDDHVTKPLDPEELFKALVKHINPLKRPVRETPPPKAVAGGQQRKAVRLPELPGIDTASALARVGGRPDTLIRLIKKFGSGHADAVDAIAALLNTGKTRKAREAAHALKGVSGNIGAAGLHQAAAALELAIKEERHQEWESLLESANRMLAQVMASIRRLDDLDDDQPTHAGAAAPPLPLDRTRIMATLAELKNLLENNSFGAGKQVEALAVLLEGSMFHQELVDLKKRVERYQFKAALSAAGKLEKRLSTE